MAAFFSPVKARVVETFGVHAPNLVAEFARDTLTRYRCTGVPPVDAGATQAMVARPGAGVAATRRKLTAEYKIEAAHRVTGSGRSIAEVARERSVNEVSLGNWVRAERRRLDAPWLAPIPSR